MLLVGQQEGHPACKNWLVRYWHLYLSGARCKWFVSSWRHGHPIISCSSKIQNGLPFWCWLTQVVLEKGHYTDVVVLVVRNNVSDSVLCLLAGTSQSRSCVSCLYLMTRRRHRLRYIWASCITACASLTRHSTLTLHSSTHSVLSHIHSLIR